MNPRIEKTIRLTRNKFKRVVRKIKAKVNHESPIPAVKLNVQDSVIGVSSNFAAKEKSNGGK
jgi:hypothetical protein